MRFRFGRYELDEEAGELRCDGRPAAIQPKPFALLCLLVRERGRAVSSDELLDLLWPGVAVTPGSLTRAVSLARRAIGDERREWLRNVSRRGYRFTADVEVAEAPAARPAAGAAPEDTRPFVGRGDALARLRSLWSEARAGRGGIALVIGPAGIGKTHLVERFGAEVEAEGSLVLPARARAGEGVPAFWLWAQVLRGLAQRGPEPEALRALTGAPAELEGLVPGLDASAGSAAGLGAEQRRFLFFDGVARLLAKAARRRPLCLVLEDLQWAGAPSLRLLDHLAWEVPGGALLAVGTVREEPRPEGDPLDALLAALRQQGRCAEIPLRGLSRGEVAELLERRLERPAPADLSSELYARTEGVPLVLLEAIRLLEERGELRDPERVRRWSVSLPARTLDLIRRPLARLSPGCAELLEGAAVLGREFAPSLAAAVAERSRDEAALLLDEAARAGAVERVPGDPAAWRFTHALVREAAYEGIAAGRRALLHRRAAEALERRHAVDPERVVAEIAHHRHESLAVGDPELAHAWAVRAAERAARLLAHEQAALHYAQAVAALDAADPVDPVRRLSALFALGEAHRLAGDRPRRRGAFAAAIEAARSLGRPSDRARAAVGFCDLSEWAPSDPEGLAFVSQALAELPADGGLERAQLLTRLAYLSMREHPAQAEPVAREAVALARREADSAVLQDALYTLFFLLAGPDHLEERAALAEESLASMRRAGATDTALITLVDMACERVLLGDRSGALRWRALAGDIAGGDPHHGRLFHLRLFDAGHALLEGRFADAARLAEEAVRLGRRIGHPYTQGIDRSIRAALARERGDDAGLLRIFEPTRPIRLGPVQWVQAQVARSLAALGRAEEARSFHAELVAPGVETIPRNIRWHDTIVEIAHLCADLGDEDTARSLVALLTPVAHHHGVLPLSIYYAGPFTRALARLHETLGHEGEAGALYEQALAASAALAAQPMQARVLAEHGRFLLRRGERASARERLGEACRLATALGMQGVAAAARADLARA
jgi:DNA-binding winged helix-turn-helix (wHTH) protein